MQTEDGVADAGGGSFSLPEPGHPERFEALCRFIETDEAKARSIVGVMGLEAEPDLAEIGLLMYRALLPGADRETALFAGLRLLSPFWREAMETGSALTGLVIDFRHLQLHTMRPDGLKLDSGFYDLADARLGGPPDPGRSVFARMVHITNFRELFLQRLHADAEQAAEE